MKRLKSIAKYILEFIKYYTLYPFAIAKYGRRRIFLLSERGTDARDNGHHMYRYIRQNHPELETYYVIQKDSADVSKVQPYGNVVWYRSLRHYLLFIAANYKISTHIAGYSPEMHFYNRFSKFICWRGKRIFLQHGIIKDDLEGLYWENTHVDLFICGARPEFEDISSRYHYKDQVKYTGLARYDALMEFEEKPQILIMPTWRMYLNALPHDQVSSSDYIKSWSRVLCDRRLTDAAKEAGIRVVFYPHYEAQKYLEAFQPEDASVVIADFAHYDVQQLLKESKLLVTDYSSVFFDVGYMGKPCVYYQFDREKFYATHYKKGYFDYDTMGFGEVALSHEVLIDVLVRYIQTGFCTPDAYKDRAGKFFPLRDRNNCKRIMDEILKL